MRLPLFTLAELMVGAVVLATALLHLVLALHGIRRSLNLKFVLLAVFVALSAFASPVRYLSESIPQIVLGIKLTQSGIVAYGIALCWFVKEYSGQTKWWIPAVLTALGCLSVGLNLYYPQSLLYAHTAGIRSFEFPGGGVGHTIVGQPHPLLFLGHIFGIGVVSYAAAGCVRLWRDGAQRAKALAFSAGIAPVVLFVFPQGLLVNRGLLQPPSYYTFAFLGLVAVMSYDIVSDTALSVVLSGKVRSNERRWKSLLENVSLMVLICDRQGRIEYANPFLTRTAEYELAELVGRPFRVLFPEPEVPALLRLFERAMKGSVLDHIQTGFLTRSGQERVILWSNVLLYGNDEEIMGVLSVGNDLSERVDAEKARDKALAEISALKEQLEAENQYLRLEYAAGDTASEFVGQSDAIRYVSHKINQVAPTSATVLIEGETGVGKELVARAIHNASPRSLRPFIKVNCAALSASLIESELFGHERGAFTGADRAHPGRFELAEGGTLLLDEIGELPLDLQVKLLRVLQEGEYDRVGSTKSRRADVRVIASTNRNLLKEVERGRFREDLYYRLQVFPISVPPLRDRREDIPLLVHHFVQTVSQKLGRPVPQVPMKLVRQLTDREWHGNVRELQNVIERAIITSVGGTLSLPPDLAAAKPEATMGLEPLTLDAIERRHIEEVLKRTNGQIAGQGGAAEILGLHPNTLRGRMAKLGVQRPQQPQ